MAFEEPLSVLAEGAIALHELFASLTNAGFTEEQALRIVSNVIVNPSEGTTKPGDA